MSNTRCLLALIGAVATGCKPTARNVIVATPPSAAGTPTAPAAMAPAPSRPSEPPQLQPPGLPPVLEPVPIDDKIVERFIAFDKKYLASLPQRMQSMRDELRKIEQAERTQVPAGSGPAGGAAQGVLERMKVEDDRLRAEAGVTAAQAQTVQELAMALSAVKAKKADLAEAQKKYGKASLDVALRHEKDLVALWEAHLKTLQDAMRLMMQR